ncbi:MAG: 50S ribosomal protein L30e [Candidatus Bathyarchaeota archaeon]
MIDLDKAILTALRTGKVEFGANNALKNVKTGKTKMVVLASNCPETIRAAIENYSQLAGVPLIIYKGSSTDLATLCEKPFIISALSIKEPGDSEILRVTEVESEEEHGGAE